MLWLFEKSDGVRYAGYMRLRLCRIVGLNFTQNTNSIFCLKYVYERMEFFELALDPS